MARTCYKAIEFVNADGKQDALPIGELMAVERSGQSARRDYIMEKRTRAAKKYAIIPLMAKRPGQSKPGSRPSQEVYLYQAKHMSALEIAFVQDNAHLTLSTLSAILSRGKAKISKHRPEGAGYRRTASDTVEDAIAARAMWQAMKG